MVGDHHTAFVLWVVIDTVAAPLPVQHKPITLQGSAKFTDSDGAELRREPHTLTVNSSSRAEEGAVPWLSTGMGSPWAIRDSR